MALREIAGFMAIAGLPALFLIGWIACWVVLHRAPLWGFGVASAVSAGSIVLAWGVASTGAATGGEHKNILFQSLMFNGITGLLWVGVLAIATAIMELVRMVLNAGSSDSASEQESAPAPHQT